MINLTRTTGAGIGRPRSGSNAVAAAAVDHRLPAPVHRPRVEDASRRPGWTWAGLWPRGVPAGRIASPGRLVVGPVLFLLGPASRSLDGQALTSTAALVSPDPTDLRSTDEMSFIAPAHRAQLHSTATGPPANGGERAAGCLPDHGAVVQLARSRPTRRGRARAVRAARRAFDAGCVAPGDGAPEAPGPAGAAWADAIDGCRLAETWRTGMPQHSGLVLRELSASGTFERAATIFPSSLISSAAAFDRGLARRTRATRRSRAASRSGVSRADRAVERPGSRWPALKVAAASAFGNTAS